MLKLKEARQTRNGAIHLLKQKGLPDETIAAAFSLTKKTVGNILRDPTLMEGIMHTAGRQKKSGAIKRLSAKEAEIAFSDLSVRASNSLRVVHVTTLPEFRAWWKSRDEAAKREHQDVLYGHLKVYPPWPLLKTGEELTRLAVGLGLKEMQPLRSYPRPPNPSD